MTEREACALLKARFEQAGYQIAENQPFDEDGVTFEIDGFDATARVGYEYITEEAGDSWDVDGTVIATLEARREQGTLHVLVIDEATAPDPTTLESAARAFLLALPKPAAATVVAAAPTAEHTAKTPEPKPKSKAAKAETEPKSKAPTKPKTAKAEPKPKAPKAEPKPKAAKAEPKPKPPTKRSKPATATR